MIAESGAPSTLGWLECSLCRKATETNGLRGLCECGGVLLARYHLDEAARTMTAESLQRRPPNQWRYSEVLPGAEVKISLGEGMTPLLHAAFAGRSLGLERDSDAACWRDDSRGPADRVHACGTAASTFLQ